MNQVAKKEDDGKVVPLSESASMMEIIGRAASDPNVDIDKMERLMAMAERAKDREAKVAFTSALAELQPKLPIITERGGIADSRGKVQSKYAYYEDIIEAVGPLLSEHGFAVTFRPRREGDQQVVVGVLMHRGGHSEEAEIRLPMDNSGSKNAVQGVGSSLSYGKRYAICALLNITTGGEDDDGVKAGITYLNKERRQEIVDLLDEVAAITGENEAEIFCTQFLNVPSIAEIPANLYDKARHGIRAKLANVKKGSPT